MAQTSTQAAVNGSPWGVGDALGNIFDLGNQYVSAYIESRFEPAPQTVSAYQAGGVTTTEPVTPQGETLNNATAQNAAPMNKNFIYAAYGIGGLIALLLVLKLLGVI
jgi:hypothetical protein